MSATHRFQSHLEDFNKATALVDKRSLESFFDGPKKLDDIFIEYFTIIEREKAYREGLQDGKAAAHKEINEEIKKYVEQYIGKVIKVAHYVANLATEQLSKTQDKFVMDDARAKFSLEKSKIQILFVINATFEKEIEFIKLCGNLEKLLRELEQDYLCSIACLNVGVTSQEIDYSLIKTDYPFAIKVFNR